MVLKSNILEIILTINQSKPTKEFLSIILKKQLSSAEEAYASLEKEENNWEKNKKESFILLMNLDMKEML